MFLKTLPLVFIPRTSAIFIPMEGKEIRLRCWIEVDGKKFFGPGPAQLLELIQQEGSIAKAAKIMGMSYKKAWDIVTDLNSRGKSPYVISRKGGEKGGGAELTDTGKEAVRRYRELVDSLNVVVVREKDFLAIL